MRRESLGKMLLAVFLVTVLCALLPASVLSSSLISPSPCDPIDAAFNALVDVDETPACRCFMDPESSGEPWLGCTGHSMPAVFDSLRSLNETLLSRLAIWDSLINIIPSDMFAKVRPRSLSISRSGLALLRERAFANIGSRLKHLHLRQNIIKRIDTSILSDLPRLRSIDLSGNRLRVVGAKDLSAVGELTDLNLADNDISVIQEGAFLHTPHLRSLSLSRNKISAITNTTFLGLSKLERLELSMNELSSIDWSAFSELKSLKYLDLGTNHISSIHLRGLPGLEKLILNNNSILSLRNVSLRDLPSLTMLNIDRNSLTDLNENDLFGLSLSTRLTSLSLAANNISSIHPRAFSPVSSLSVLALQNNHLLSLSGPSEPLLSPLRRLSSLLLSGNAIHLLRDGELPSSLSLIALDHNGLQTIDPKAFEGLSLTHLFLNNNRLTHLPRGIFDSFSNESLEAIDLSWNDWQCLCGEEWLGAWLEGAGEKDVSEKRAANGCLIRKSCTPSAESAEESSPAWVTAAAAVLACVSLVLLLGIAWLFVEEGRHGSSSLLSVRSSSRHSDTRRLIMDDVLEKQKQRRLLPRPPSPLLPPPIPSSANLDKKRVRFHD